MSAEDDYNHKRVAHQQMQIDAAGARVTALFRGGDRAISAGEGEEIDLVTDVTPFYGEAGGQVGDRGEASGDGARLEIVSTRRSSADIV